MASSSSDGSGTVVNPLAPSPHIIRTESLEADGGVDQQHGRRSTELEASAGCGGGGASDEPWGVRVQREVSLLLHFSMLAASTIGPGTVVVCSKSGADFGLDLVWALVLASFVAYVLQEGSARLARLFVA